LREKELRHAHGLNPAEGRCLGDVFATWSETSSQPLDLRPLSSFKHYKNIREDAKNPATWKKGLRVFNMPRRSHGVDQSEGIGESIQQIKAKLPSSHSGEKFESTAGYHEDLPVAASEPDDRLVETMEGTFDNPEAKEVPPTNVARKSTRVQHTDEPQKKRRRIQKGQTGL